METLVIYDIDGFILLDKKGEPKPREPIGVPFLWATIPEGKRMKTNNGIGVDVSVQPHVLILEDIPKTETQELREVIEEQSAALVDVVMYIDALLGGK